MYVCVKAKLTFVSFFPFFLHLPLSWIKYDILLCHSCHMINLLDLVHILNLILCTVVRCTVSIFDGLVCHMDNFNILTPTKHVNCDKTDFVTKQHMLGFLIITAGP